MQNVEKLGEVISTDVLILGGGISGLCAAIKAKENPVDVLVVDKGGIGWAGQAPIGGGMVMHIEPERADDWSRWIIGDGGYLHNQDWTYTMGREIHNTIMELASLGMPFTKKKGEVSIVPFEKYYDLTLFDPPKSMLKLRSAAKKRGVQTLDKVYVSELLQRDGRVVGAMGFGLVDGKTYIFNAKAVLIAVGSCRYMAESSFGVNTGEGPAMAYRAGAVLRSAEFGSNSYTFGARLTGQQFLGFSAYLHLENGLGEKIMERHYPNMIANIKAGKERRDYRLITDVMIKEVEAGRGPIYLDMSKLTTEEKDHLLAKGIPVLEELAQKSLSLLEQKAKLDPMQVKLEMHPMLVGGQGPIKIDLECRTTVDGLWAAGDAASLGSGWTGARSSGGSYRGLGLAFGSVSGLRAGASIGKNAASAQRSDIDAGEVKRTKEKIFSPLGRSSKSGGPADVIYQVHEAIVPMKYNFNREAGRLKEALGIIERAKQNLDGVGVSDHHGLLRYHQAKSMALAAELATKAALMREESRGQHYRQDFPNRDDKKWLKWITIQEKGGDPQFSTEAVPIEKYKVKPA